MQSRPSWSYMLSLVSFPFLLLARAGLLGQQARGSAEAALTTWSDFGHALLGLLALLALVFALVLLYLALR